MDTHDNNTYCDLIGISPLKDFSLILAQEIDKALVLWWEKEGRGKNPCVNKMTHLQVILAKRLTRYKKELV